MKNMQNKMPKNMTEKISLATKKDETIISYQQIVQQYAPKILRAILSNQLKKIFRHTQLATHNSFWLNTKNNKKRKTKRHRQPTPSD